MEVLGYLCVSVVIPLICLLYTACCPQALIRLIALSLIRCPSIRLFWTLADWVVGVGGGGWWWDGNGRWRGCLFLERRRQDPDDLIEHGSRPSTPSLGPKVRLKVHLGTTHSTLAFSVILTRMHPWGTLNIMKETIWEYPTRPSHSHSSSLWECIHEEPWIYWTI